MTTKQTLIAARALIVKGWCQRAEAVTKTDRITYPESKSAVACNKIGVAEKSQKLLIEVVGL